ncbi:MAG: response regulator [Kiritimatiellae bacterium]|nr:response regulator [Kiritimatiellia bacterium]
MAKPLSVLLADDEPMILKSVSRYLQRRRYSVVTCRDGDEALKKATSGPFDVVIADLELPVAAGGNLVDHLLESGLPCRLIVISGHVRTPEALSDRTRDIQFLQKPFDLDILAEMVDSAGGAPG